MKLKNKKTIIIIASVVIILSAIILIVKNIKEENDTLNSIMKKITNNYNELEDNIKNYNKNREELSSSLDNYYTESLSNDYNKYINLLNSQETTITAIQTNIEDLSTNCQDRLYSKKEINNICNSYEEYYETVVNIYINDQNQINEMIKIYNEDSDTPLDEYHSKNFTDYIDYNNDGKYLERED